MVIEIRVEKFWSEIMLVISNRTRAPCCTSDFEITPNCILLSAITIMNYKGYNSPCSHLWLYTTDSLTWVFILKIENLTALSCRMSNVPQEYHKYSEGLDCCMYLKYAYICIAPVRYICKQLFETLPSLATINRPKTTFLGKT